jgi:hypothetical protein
MFLPMASTERRFSSTMHNDAAPTAQGFEPVGTRSGEQVKATRALDTGGQGFENTASRIRSSPAARRRDPPDNNVIPLALPPVMRT